MPTPNETPYGSATIRILVIDDDARIRQMIRLALEVEGFVVDTAADGQQGLEQASRSRPAAVVLDMHLPVVDGAAVADGLRALDGERLPIVLITADDRPEERARRVGAYACLRKPFDLDDLITAIRRGLNARSA
jgi:two-component system response regulator MprA